MVESYREESHPEEDGLCASEAARLLWDWRKYRNTAYWMTMYRFGMAGLVVSLIPYVLPGVLRELRYAVLVFPFVAALLFLVATYLLVVHQTLYRVVDKKFRAVLGSYDPGHMSVKSAAMLGRGITMARAILILFACCAISQLLNALVLLSLVRAL
jgi:hypothetical protein